MPRRRSLEFGKAQAINEAMIKVSPDKPRYRSDLGSDLDSLALAMSALGQPKVDETFAAASAIFERLIAAHPENIDYRIRQAMCLRNQGGVLHRRAGPNRPRRSIAKGSPCSMPPTPSSGRRTGSAGRPRFCSTWAHSWRGRRGRLETLDRHLAAAPGRQAGCRRGPPQPGHRRRTTSECCWSTAIASLDAGPYFARSLENFEKLVTDAPECRRDPAATSASSWPNRENGWIKAASRPTPRPRSPPPSSTSARPCDSAKTLRRAAWRSPRT